MSSALWQGSAVQLMAMARRMPIGGPFQAAEYI